MATGTSGRRLDGDLTLSLNNSLLVSGRRVAELYSALVEGRAPAPRQFGPLAALIENEAEYRVSERFVRDREYWRERLADLPDGAPSSQPNFSRLTLPPYGVGAFRRFGGRRWGDRVGHRPLSATLRLHVSRHT